MRAFYSVILRLYHLLFHRVPQDTIDKELVRYDEYLVKHFTEGSILLWAGGEYVEDADIRREIEYARKHPIVV